MVCLRELLLENLGETLECLGLLDILGLEVLLGE